MNATQANETKEETKFTRGPWRWEYDQDSGRPVALSNGPTDVLLATGDESSTWAEVTEADADLIASAPEMLAAVKEALTYVHAGECTVPLYVVKMLEVATAFAKE